MEEINWGLSGPEILVSERRTRTLNIGGAIRNFNDLAIPGMGGVWFGKQLYLSLLGISVAENLYNNGKKIKNIEMSNAIEALGCWLELNKRKWKSEARLLGASKMRSKTDLSFITVRKSGFYVTQPRRMATVQALSSLGLVESIGERFNTYSCSDIGNEFIELVNDGFSLDRLSVTNYLKRWVNGSNRALMNSQTINALSPVSPLSIQSRDFLKECLVQGESEESIRRRNALVWMKELSETNDLNKIIWDKKPVSIDEIHWKDLHSGSLFFSVRDSAIKLLDTIESFIANKSETKLDLNMEIPEHIRNEISALNNTAEEFIKFGYDPTNNKIASGFCQECVDKKDSDLLINLVKRDGRVLKIRDEAVIPGPAYKGIQLVNELNSFDAASQYDEGIDLLLPDGISHRVRNFYLLYLDIEGKLDSWLLENGQAIGVEGE